MTTGSPLTGLRAGAVLAAVGVHLLWTAAHGDATGSAPAPHGAGGAPARASDDWLAQAGLDGRRPRGVRSASWPCSFVVGAALALRRLRRRRRPPSPSALFAATFPPASYRRRRATRLAKAQEAWPRMIEEIRILTGSLGRSIPQALFEVGPARARSSCGRRSPPPTASGCSPPTSTARSRVLKDRLADPTADAACETLLVAHELGGTDLDRRLAALAEDRIQDTQGRKDARAKQAGVRFARRFVLDRARRHGARRHVGRQRPRRLRARRSARCSSSPASP